MRQTLIQLLKDVTDVENWNSITFGILPADDPKGFIFLASSEVINTVRSQHLWGVAIAVSAVNLNELSDTVESISKKIRESLNKPTGCLPEGSVVLDGSIGVEPPQSYPNQGNMSGTTGFFTAISFILRVE